MFEILYIGSIFCALLTIYLLLLKENAIKSYSNYILSSILLLEIYFVIIYLLIYTGYINKTPFLYKTAAPFNFLIAPLAYLYVKSVLFNKKGLSHIDSLHLLPFIFSLINYFSFYIMPMDAKRVIVQKVTEDLIFAFKYQAGYLPEYLVFSLKILQTLIYLILQWSLIINFKKQNNNLLIQIQIIKVVKWLKVFTFLFTTILLGFLFMAYYFNKIPIDSYVSFTNLIQSLLLSVSFFILSSYLLVNPSVLDGLPFIKYKLQESSLSNLKESRPFIVENFEKEIEQIENHLKTKKVFLDPKLSLAQISVTLDIPIKDLSYIINNHFGVRFNDFINRYRIDYFSKMLNEEYLEKYTIDSLITQAGFSSKSTFHAAFKKVYNCTPSQYLNKQNSKIN